MTFNLPNTKHSQNVLPLKRNEPSFTNSCQILHLKLLQLFYALVFAVSGSPTKEKICDLVREQLMKYQLECIPESFYLAEASAKEERN